jgi:RNA polymerase-binding transcription factor
VAKTEPTLTKDQLELLRRRLEEERSRILTVLRAPAGSDEERSELEETAQRATEQSDRLRLIERERELLADVERALAKLRDGRYGIDEETGEPIPYARLAAIPWARGRAD